MADRRGFVAGLTALLFGGPALAQRAIREDRQGDRGFWRGAGDPDGTATVLIVDGYLLGHCTGFNEEALMVEVDIATPKPGEYPGFVLCDDHFASQRLYLGSALEIYRDGRGYPNKGFRFWTGKGWINKNSEPIPGPIPGIVKRYVAGEPLAKNQAMQIRNGRAYRA